MYIKLKYVELIVLKILFTVSKFFLYLQTLHFITVFFQILLSVSSMNFKILPNDYGIKDELGGTVLIVLPYMIALGIFITFIISSDKQKWFTRWKKIGKRFLKDYILFGFVCFEIFVLKGNVDPILKMWINPLNIIISMYLFYHLVSLLLGIETGKIIDLLIIDKKTYEITNEWKSYLLLESYETNQRKERLHCFNKEKWISKESNYSVRYRIAKTWFHVDVVSCISQKIQDNTSGMKGEK